MGSPVLRPLALRGLALLTGTLAAMLLLGLVELGFRAFVPPVDALPPWIPERARGPSDRAARTALHQERVRVHESDRHLFWRNRAGVDTVWQGIGVRTNRLGLRDDEIPPVKGPGELRILVLGESTAFGAEVEQHETFVEVLEDDLTRGLPACRVSVINAAVTGYSLFQSHQYLLRRGLALEPDLVLIYHGYNDFLPTTYVAERADAPESRLGLTDRQLYQERMRFPNRLDLWLYFESAAYRWLRTAVARWRPELPQVGRSTVRRVPVEDREALLEATRALLAERDIGFVVLVPAYRGFARHRETLLAFSARTDTPAIDLQTTLPPGPRQRAALFREDGVHPVPRLHRRFADRIGRRLREDAGALGLAACAPRD